MKTISRRELLKKTGVIGGGLFATGPILANIREFCGLTPPQTEGPFYPVKDQQDKDWDLTQVKGRRKLAKGQMIWISGTVLDETCQPIEKAWVEIWQAAFSGRYNHPGDTSGLELDPNFQYWGRAVTDANGGYRFKTVVPGHYPADVNWTRPPHIHYKVFAKGFQELTTQMYFKGASFSGDKGKLIDELNRKDLILNKLSAQEQNQVIVEFTNEGELSKGVFDITLKRV